MKTSGTAMAAGERILEQVVSATGSFGDMLRAQPVVKEVYRAGDTVVWHVHRAGGDGRHEDAEVRLDAGPGRAPRVTMNHSSGSFESPSDAMAHAQALLAATHLMTWVKTMLLTAEAARNG